MKRHFPLFVGTLALCLPAFSVAPCAEQVAPFSFPADPFEALQKALRAERESRARTAGASGTGREVYETSGYLEAIRQSMSRGDEANALSALSQIEAMATTPELRRACEALVEKINKDRSAREQTISAEVDAASKRAGEIALQAREPKELDAQIEIFNRLAEERSSRYSDGRDNRATQKIQGALTFLARWQDYLAAVANGDDQAASNIMRNLADNNSSHVLLVPRSEIVARQTAAHRGESETAGDHFRKIAVETNAAVAEILDGCRTLADIPTALARLNGIWTKMPGNNNSYLDNSTDIGAAISNLQAIQRANAELRTGLSITINVSTLRSENVMRPAVDSRLAGLRAELILLALPRLLNSPDARPAADERVNEFLHRLVEAAKARNDWESAARGIEIARLLVAGTANSGNNYQAPSDGFKQFFVGLNMESSGQYEQAVIAFLTALKTGAQDLPTRVIGEHLAVIQKEHPKEFGDANTYILNPPVPQYPAGAYGPNYNPYPNRRLMIDPRTGRPMQETAETPTPTPALTVPAAPTPAPSPKATPPPEPKPTP